MITTERSLVYVVRGKRYFDKRAAYRREALMQLLDECAKTCESFDGIVPSVEACRDCENRPSEDVVNARAGLLFEADNGGARQEAHIA